MLNSHNVRELAYLVKVDSISNIPDYDRIELAHIGGWTCVVGKDEMKAGDIAVYFEIDSQLPDVMPFSDMEFLRSKHFKIKSQRMCKGAVISQGLLMHVSSFGWEQVGDTVINTAKAGVVYRLDDDTRFVTQELGVTYAVAEDNFRKGPGRNKEAKYTFMCARHKNLAKQGWWRWLMKRDWGKKLLFVFFGKKNDKPSDWPYWVVKTDEERIQNMPWILKEDPMPQWYVTEKIDGTSTTFTMRQAKPKKRKMLVCSRNVVYDKPEKNDMNFYKDTEGNVYLEMAEKYNVEKALNFILDLTPELEYITIQGETYGGNIQKRNYGPEHRLAIFNVIYKKKDADPVRLNPEEMIAYINGINKDCDLNLECVPFLDVVNNLPAECDDMIACAHGESKIDGGMREGLVFRSVDGVRSFKAVDNEYLLKYHVG